MESRLSNQPGESTQSNGSKWGTANPGVINWELTEEMGAEGRPSRKTPALLVRGHTNLPGSPSSFPSAGPTDALPPASGEAGSQSRRGRPAPEPLPASALPLGKGAPTTGPQPMAVGRTELDSMRRRALDTHTGSSGGIWISGTPWYGSVRVSLMHTVPGGDKHTL